MEPLVAVCTLDHLSVIEVQGTHWTNILNEILLLSLSNQPGIRVKFGMRQANKPVSQ